MLRELALLGMVILGGGLSSRSHAEILLNGFSWQPEDGHYELSFANDSEPPVVVQGLLAEGGKSEAKAEGILSVDIRSYGAGYLTITVIPDKQEIGSVYLLAPEGARDVAQLNEQPIHGRKAALVMTVDRVVHWEVEDALASMNKPVGEAFAAMANYFAKNPQKTVTDFYDQVELGNIR